MVALWTVHRSVPDAVQIGSPQNPQIVASLQIPRGRRVQLMAWKTIGLILLEQGSLAKVMIVIILVIICDYNEFEEKTCSQIQVVYLRLDPLMVILLLSQSQLGASCHAACGRCWEDYYCRKIWKKEKNEGKHWWDLQHMNALSFSALGRICSNPVGVASSPPATYQALF